MNVPDRSPLTPVRPQLSPFADVGRRRFLQSAAALSAATVSATTLVTSRLFGDEPAAPAGPAAPTPEQAALTKDRRLAEEIVAKLHETLSDKQRKEVCFDWDHLDPKRGLLRTRVSNNWHITSPVINSDFFTTEQRGLIREVFEAIITPDWHAKIDKQLQDDAGGFGNDQNIALFGKPDGKFQFVMTGRHMTLRCDGDSAEHVAFGGPIFYGHAAGGFDEEPSHPGNVFWEQAIAANRVCAMLDGKQRQRAQVASTPSESEVGFQGKSGKFVGLPVAELSPDQREALEQTLVKLLEPYRQVDQAEVRRCLAAQGGLDACHLAYFTDEDVGDDKVWDNWRIEGPSFVWYFRGYPHVHVWVNVADSSDVKLNADG